MGNNVISNAATGALATSIAVVVSLTTVSAISPSANPLDAPLFKAVQVFAWASALLAGYLILDGVASTLSNAGKSMTKTGRYIRVLWFFGGSVCWIQGAIALLAHFHIPGVEVVLIQSAFVAAAGVAGCELASSGGTSTPVKPSSE